MNHCHTSVNEGKAAVAYVLDFVIGRIRESPSIPLESLVVGDWTHGHHRHFSIIMGLLYRLHRERKLRVIIPLDGTGPPRLESPNKNSDIQPGIARYKVSPTSQGPAREHGTNKTRQLIIDNNSLNKEYEQFTRRRAHTGKDFTASKPEWIGDRLRELGKRITASKSRFMMKDHIKRDQLLARIIYNALHPQDRWIVEHTYRFKTGRSSLLRLIDVWYMVKDLPEDLFPLFLKNLKHIKKKQRGDWHRQESRYATGTGGCTLNSYKNKGNYPRAHGDSNGERSGLKNLRPPINAKRRRLSHPPTHQSRTDQATYSTWRNSGYPQDLFDQRQWFLHHSPPSSSHPGHLGPDMACVVLDDFPTNLTEITLGDPTYFKPQSGNGRIVDKQDKPSFQTNEKISLTWDDYDDDQEDNNEQRTSHGVKGASSVKTPLVPATDGTSTLQVSIMGQDGCDTNKPRLSPRSQPTSHALVVTDSKKKPRSFSSKDTWLLDTASYRHYSMTKQGGIFRPIEGFTMKLRTIKGEASIKDVWIGMFRPEAGKISVGKVVSAPDIDFNLLSVGQLAEKTDFHYVFTATHVIAVPKNAINSWLSANGCRVVADRNKGTGYMYAARRDTLALGSSNSPANHHKQQSPDVANYGGRSSSPPPLRSQHQDDASSPAEARTPSEAGSAVMTSCTADAPVHPYPKIAGQRILIQQHNPKSGSAGMRFAAYKTASTVGQMLAKGGTIGDLHFDLSHGYTKTVASRRPGCSVDGTPEVGADDKSGGCFQGVTMGSGGADTMAIPSSAKSTASSLNQWKQGTYHMMNGLLDQTSRWRYSTSIEKEISASTTKTLRNLITSDAIEKINHKDIKRMVEAGLIDDYIVEPVTMFHAFQEDSISDTEGSKFSSISSKIAIRNKEWSVDKHRQVALLKMQLSLAARFSYVLEMFELQGNTHHSEFGEKKQVIEILNRGESIGLYLLKQKILGMEPVNLKIKMALLGPRLQFRHSSDDTSLFSRSDAEGSIFARLWGDNLIITASSSNLIGRFETDFPYDLRRVSTIDHEKRIKIEQPEEGGPISFSQPDYITDLALLYGVITLPANDSKIMEWTDSISRFKEPKATYPMTPLSQHYRIKLTKKEVEKALLHVSEIINTSRPDLTARLEVISHLKKSQRPKRILGVIHELYSTRYRQQMIRGISSGHQRGFNIYVSGRKDRPETEGLHLIDQFNGICGCTITVYGDTIWSVLWVLRGRGARSLEETQIMEGAMGECERFSEIYRKRANQLGAPISIHKPLIRSDMNFQRRIEGVKPHPRLPDGARFRQVDDTRNLAYIIMPFASKDKYGRINRIQGRKLMSQFFRDMSDGGANAS